MKNRIFLFIYFVLICVIKFKLTDKYLATNAPYSVFTVARGADRGDFETLGGMEGSLVAFPPKHDSPP